MQAVLFIPELWTWRHQPTREVLLREIAGVPLLTRVLATATRAGVDSVVVIWPQQLDRRILLDCLSSPLIKGLRSIEVTPLVSFDPDNSQSWREIGHILETQFIWLPWNWVTNKRELCTLVASHAWPTDWGTPVLLMKSAIVDGRQLGVSPAAPSAGVSIASPESVGEAERFLVARSGKPTDGIYSRFNRWLCRPAVRWLSHTAVTPNQVTLAGLAIGAVAAVSYAHGSYPFYVAGALLFFLSGLVDEIDGMLARIKFLESAFGTWFEGFVDNATYLLLFAGVTAGLYRQRGPRELAWGTALIAGCLLSVAVVAIQRKLATAPDRPHEYAGTINSLMEGDSRNPISLIVRQIHIFIKKGVAIHYVLLFTVLGGLPLFLRLAAVAANLTWTLALYFNRRFFGRTRADRQGFEVKPAA
jgi:phosphatidylglycerophosphate synthase